MSNLVCRLTTGLIGRLDKSVWLTNDLNFRMAAVDMSLITVQLKDELYLLANLLAF